MTARSTEERMGALREHGLDPQSPPGSGRVYFKDPDGVILQLSSELMALPDLYARLRPPRKRNCSCGPAAA